MKVAIAPYLSDRDIVIGSLNEIIDAGIDVPPEMKRILRRPDVLALSLAARLMGKSRPEALNIAAKMHFERRLGVNSPHPTAESASHYLGDAWSDYKKFCFVRNPYERVASDYNWWRRMSNQSFSFSEYLMALRERDDSEKIVHPGAVSNWEMMTIGDDFQIDIVGRYESLEADFATTTAKLGLPALKLGTAEKATVSGRDYGSLYSETEKKSVAEMFRHEIDRFSYDFPY